MENSLLADNSVTGGSGDAGNGGGDQESTAKDGFSQEGGAWEEAKRYNSSLFDD